MNNGRGDYIEQWRHIEPLIQVLIISTREYIVFIDKDGDIDWETTQEYDEKAPKDVGYDLAKANLIRNEAAVIETTPCGALTPDTKLQFKRLIGEAIACVFDHDYDGAKGILGSAAQFIRARSEEISRFWYLSASFAAAALFLVLGFSLWLLRSYVSSLLTPLEMWLALASVAGAIGALLSVIWRSGDLKFNSSSGRALHYLEASSRICAGALSGFLVALAVNCEIILTAFTHNNNLHGIMILAALAAGASERMAGSIISKFDTAETKVTAKSYKKDQPS
jgi:hypothetical protein